MQLTRTTARVLETEKTFLLTMIELQGRVECSVELHEEPGEVLITLLMEDLEIQHAVKDAVEEVLGTEYSVSDISISCGKRLISFAISKSC